MPAGGTDGEAPLVAAQRELREETGLVAAQWTEVGRMDALNGVCEAAEVVYLATDLTAVDNGTGQHEEGITEVRAVSMTRVLELVRSG